MDLTAYMQIEDIEKIAADNNIVVPRLRGYRLMKDEDHVNSDEIKRLMKDFELIVCEDLCRSDPFWDANANCYSCDPRIEYLCRYYLVEETDDDGYKKYTGIRWDRIHGWKRKRLKFEIKKKKRQIQKQIDMWNKYVGNANVLYIHARIGGCNWNYYAGNELAKSPWFLDKVDDCFDNTYCDIYASIK